MALDVKSSLQQTFPVLLLRVGWLELSFLILLAAALGIRLWELDGRVMHYDEAIHLYQSWQLSNMVEYVHSPWMHGPFQIEFTALVFVLLGDTDVTARLGYVLSGTALVVVPYFLRKHLGNWGALFTGVMLAASPALLYFSRFGRNDILMAFWAAALLALFWKYSHEARDRYLYLASAVLAFMFATKETAYFVVFLFGALAFLLALLQWAGGRLDRAKLAQATGPAAGFFLLLVTITLPQWSALAGMFQDLAGLTLITRDGATTGIVGAPHWGGPVMSLPVADLHPGMHSLPALLAAAGVVGWAMAAGFPRKGLLAALVPPLAIPVAIAVALLGPVGFWAVDGSIAVALAAVATAFLTLERRHWRARLTIGLALAGLTALYTVLFTSTVNVDGLVHSILPAGISLNASSNGIPLNYVVALSVVAVALLASAVLGLAWQGRVWLVCAGIFYLVWLTCYTTLFTNWAGAFSGVWQGMGYWIAQQDVARGNQPWYYYLVELSVYESLPLVFGIIAAVYFFRKADTFGLVLAVWAALTLVAYTLASEKMPWLVVNITLPFIFLAGKFLGDMADKVRWRNALRQGTALILMIAPAGVAIGLFLVWAYVEGTAPFSWAHWVVLLGLALFAVAWAYLIRAEPEGRGLAMTGLGIAGLLLGFSLWSGLRAAYTFDDSNREVLAYAQGSADLKTTYRQLRAEAFPPSGDYSTVLVDYDTWYPFQWYVRHETEEGALEFRCFKEEDTEGWNASCRPPSASPDSNTSVFIVSARNDGDAELKQTHDKSGPRRDLLWFPESYRRPGEDRVQESLWEELSKDADFFRERVTDRRAWRAAMDYVLSRELQRDWYTAEFHLYSRQ